MSLTSTANPLVSNSVGCCASVPSSQNAQTAATATLTMANSTGVNVNLSSSSSASNASATPAAPLPNSSAYSLNPSAGSISSATTTGSTQIPIANNTSSIHVNPILHHMGEEKVYKKEKQIWLEFDTKSKDLKSQLNEGIKCLEQRLDTQISILYELQDFFKKRAEVELQYSRDLDKLVKQIYTRHKSEKTKRENWNLHSAYKLWESLLNDTKQHSKYHQVASEICSKYVADKFDEIIEDIKRIFTKCKAVGQSAHEEIFKVVGELNGAMKTYHEYQSESKQAEAKLRYVQSQKPKYEKQKSKKKLKQYEKQVEKRLQKYTETKVKAFKARNEYILSIDSANACINKFCTEDIGDIVDCMDFGFHASVAKCIYMYLSAQENIKRSRQQTVDNMSRSIGDLDSNSDKKNYLDYFSFVFNIQKKFHFEPHKGDEVSQVNAQSLIRYEMEKRYEQLDNRLKTLKTENDEIFKTIEATEQSLLSFFDVKNCDLTDLFRDLNIPVNSTGAQKSKRVEIEDYYVEKVRQYTISSNLIARLEARHRMMHKALGGSASVNNNTIDNDKSFDKLSGLAAGMSGSQNAHQLSTMGSEKKKKIGKSPIIGQPRLFGGKLIEYLNATKQDIPQIITSCIKAINRLGLHNQGIFRIPGSQLEINQFKDSFEKGEDPLVTVNPREMNSVAGVLKLYLRELKEPLFPRDLYDTFIGSLRVSTSHNAQSADNLSSNLTSNSSILNGSEATSSLSPIENIEATKIDNIRKAMTAVPKPIYIVLRYVFAFLNHLSEFKDENMMDAYNIAICLAPTLIPVPEDKKDQVNHQTDTIELIKLIIQHNEEIFNMECDGPVYEKFDSEMDNDEDICEESDEEEEESDKQFVRNLSDDELYVTEAIALYDYKGRSDKELSFKKGSLLAIRGQLSTDWWQGSLVNANANGNNCATPLKIGYIPDKYIAFRSSSKKRVVNNNNSGVVSSSPMVNNTSCRSGNYQNQNGTMNQSKVLPYTGSTPTSMAFTGASNLKSTVNRSSVDLDLNRTNLSELSQFKESDILNDDENNSSLSSSTVFCQQSISGKSTNVKNLLLHEEAAATMPNRNSKLQLFNSSNGGSHMIQNQQQTSSRSASISFNPNFRQNSDAPSSAKMLTKNTSTSIKKRNSSSPSSNSISYDPMNVNSHKPPHPGGQYNYLTLSGSSSPLTSVFNKKPTVKSQYLQYSTGNQTETSMTISITTTTSSAAKTNSILSSSVERPMDDLTYLLTNKNKIKMNQIEDALASVLDDMKQLDFSSNVASSVKVHPSHEHQQQQQQQLTPMNTNTKLVMNNASSDSSPTGYALADEKKPAEVIEIKRPDLVIDLPIILTAPSNQTSCISTTTPSGTSLPIRTLNRHSTPRQQHKKSPNQTSVNNFASTLIVNNLAKSATVATETNKIRRLSVDGLSSSDSSSLSSSPANNKMINISDNQTNAVCGEEAAPSNVLKSLLAKDNLKSSSTSSTESSSSSSSSSTSSASSSGSSSVHSSSISIGPLGKTKKPATNNYPNRTNNNNPVAKLSSNDTLNQSNEFNLNNSTNDDLTLANGDTLPPPVSEIITSQSESTDDKKPNQPNQNVAVKKQPPPLMKKPEKSEEILRKLGRSPPACDATTPQPSSDAGSTQATATMRSSSPPSVSSPLPTSKTNISLRLSNSKATDV